MFPRQGDQPLHHISTHASPASAHYGLDCPPAATKGAAIWAEMGATVGLARQANSNSQGPQAQHQAQVGYGDYDWAYAGCTAGYGYQVSSSLTCRVIARRRGRDGPQG